MKNITKEEWKKLISQQDNAIILDVRTPKECEEGIMPEAQMSNFFEFNKFKAYLAELDKSKTYFVYCRSGNRSGQACRLMKEMGLPNTYNLIGGMMEWNGEVVAI